MNYREMMEWADAIRYAETECKERGLLEWTANLIEGFFREQHLAPGPVDVSVIKEYGLTQKLSNQIRVY